MLIGTEKQAAYARDVLEGARQWCWHKFNSENLLSPEVSRGKLIAISLLQAVAEGDYAQAEAIADGDSRLVFDEKAANADLLYRDHAEADHYELPEWVLAGHLVAVADPGRPGRHQDKTPTNWADAVVVAGRVIDTFKRDYYRAQSAGLVSRIAKQAKARPAPPKSGGQAGRSGTIWDDGPPPAPPDALFDAMIDSMPDELLNQQDHDPSLVLDELWGGESQREGVSDSAREDHALDDPSALYEADEEGHPQSRLPGL